MPRMESERLCLLSLVKYVSAKLTASGWGNVTIVPLFPEDSRIRFQKDHVVGDEDEVLIPAAQLQTYQDASAGTTGMGEGVCTEVVGVSAIIFAESPGQEVDLRNFIKNALNDNEIPLYDFNQSGYPGTGGETVLSKIRCEDLRGRSVHVPMAVNASLRNGGLVVGVATFQRVMNG